MPVLDNPLRTDVSVEIPDERPLSLHRRLPDYEPTPLRSLPALAATLGIGTVLVKDESSRLGLPAFKMLGASWATYRVLRQRLGRDPEPWDTVDDLRDRLAPLAPLTLVTATDGNHGRALARVARLLGFAARVWVPENTVPARIAAIESEGAIVEVAAGGYDDAVRAAAAAAGDDTVVVSDTSWEGYSEVPRWVIEGYRTIFDEIEAQSAEAGLPSPGVVAVPIGVGALAAAAVAHYRRPGAPATTLLGVEPTAAACVGASLAAGRPVELPGVQDSIMAGLNCGTPSLVAWPLVSAGLDHLATVDDDHARAAMRALADHGVVAGESGAASLAGMMEALPHLRAAGAINGRSTVLLLSTEGATDPDTYRAVVGRSANQVVEAA
ncbi:MAG TPA: diaminopropionate ammonia-lyase [Acidimicrobiales bacterium]|nr:diaminopropionate ammonia-lyase [Acidimicrobiales bacterium]